MVEKCVVFGCSNSRNKEKGISMHKIPSFNASCFVMVSFSYVTAKKCQISYASHWLVPNEPTRQKFVQRGLQRAKNSKICCFNIVGDKLLLNFGVKSQICHGNAPYVPEPNWFQSCKMLCMMMSGH